MVGCVVFGCSNGEKKKHQEEKCFFVLTSSHSCIRWWMKRCAIKLTNAKEFDAVTEAESVSSQTIAGPEIDCAPTTVVAGSCSPRERCCDVC